ncbi:histidinol-phosphate transaminase [Mycoemilia scoparia]|uniref:histidinol-phosphate transaminase n=1 Tax=Mycoemilia scoparia TaxID=417184 RepID=A0A9W8A568_9FUNG|nr:histidinol-phosphate transaminase [Mycoemilia scoparia]
MPTKSFDLEAIVRPNIWGLDPYRCARDDYSDGILLDANENSYGPVSLTSPEQSRLQLHRYPDPLGRPVKERLLKLRPGVKSIDQIFLGVGSDEVIDLLVRVLCNPGIDEILITPPTYGMYKVVAAINDIGVVKVPLDVENGRFQLQTDQILDTLKEHPNVKIIWLCSPGNPTATRLKQEDVEKILNSSFKGIVVVDEAYIDFSSSKEDLSLAPLINSYPNLMVMQTLSKSFGLAGIRLGVGFADSQLISVLNKAKAPYNLSSLALDAALNALSDKSIQTMKATTAHLVRQRDEYLVPELLKLPLIGGIVGQSEANFVLARFVDKDNKPNDALAHKIYLEMAENRGLVVRYRGTELGCDACLRITVGTEDENKQLLKTLRTLLEAEIANENK